MVVSEGGIGQLQHAAFSVDRAPIGRGDISLESRRIDGQIRASGDMDGTTVEDSFEAWLSSLGTALGASSTEGVAAALGMAVVVVTWMEEEEVILWMWGWRIEMR